MRRDQRLWPVLMLLLLAVIVPTACVLWFMTEAMRNERLAVRQRLKEVYHGQLVALEQRVREFWREKLEALAAVDLQRSAPEIFAGLVNEKVADGVVVFDASGQPAYPSRLPPRPAILPPDSADWRHARELEFERADYAAAAGAYARIAGESSGVDSVALARQAQIRCLVKAGDSQTGITVLTDELMVDEFRRATNAKGRFIVPDVQGLALQVIRDAQDAQFRLIAESLRSRLSDYRDPALPAGQRRFLMALLQSLSPDELIFPTLEAERLTARYVDAEVPAPGNTTLLPCGLPDVWHLAAPTGRIAAIFTRETVVNDIRMLTASQGLPADVTVEVVPPGAPPSRASALESLPVGGSLAGWRLMLHVEDARFLDTAADRQIAVYLWTGLLAVVVVAILTLLIAGSLRGQMKLARLKNDLVATVSHELKTPLASMRLLVDSLLDDEKADEPQVREYLQLIARENTRLSHLIDNFLTFSRMQRGRQVFRIAETRPAEIVTMAVDALGDKFSSPACRLDVEIAPDLPMINADADAIVTVILNLLDNAHKYTEDPKCIALRAYPKNGSICFEVQDNGMGLSPRNAKRVFDRFFQVDDRLSRAGGGCGLGLSIVQFVVNAHGGSISVDSELGRGSTFVVQIPVASSLS
ncbi:MAG: HAMP domain-containing histidine kinase [Phycisphaerales bacterium]|nr:MAG: HAMP domain-containing histidine kinase [Phycisphaerales bacterium]